MKNIYSNFITVNKRLWGRNENTREKRHSLQWFSAYKDALILFFCCWFNCRCFSFVRKTWSPKNKFNKFYIFFSFESILILNWEIHRLMEIFLVNLQLIARVSFRSNYVDYIDYDHKVQKKLFSYYFERNFILNPGIIIDMDVDFCDWN